MTFYDYDEADPDAPQQMSEYRGYKPGDHVRYENPAWRQADGSYKTGGMDPPLVVTEIAAFDVDGDRMVAVVLNDGEWECNGDNLVLDVA